MIEILRFLDGKIENIEKPEKDCWINVVSPTDDEILELQKIADIPEELFTSLKDIDEIPTIIAHDSFIFIILRTPYNNLKNDLEYYTVPIGIFITKKNVLTFSYYENDVIPRIKSHKKCPISKTHLAFRIMLASARLFLNYLSEIKQKMYAIETKLEASQQNRLIMQFLEIQKSLVFFSTSLKSNNILFERIFKEKLIAENAEDRKLLEKIIDENRQAIEMTETYSNIMSNNLDAFASIISNNLNIVMRLLTSITIILTIPVLIASIYGMNINLPFQHSPHAFAIVMGISLLTSTSLVALLWRNRFI